MINFGFSLSFLFIFWSMLFQYIEKVYDVRLISSASETLDFELNALFLNYRTSVIRILFLILGWVTTSWIRSAPLANV